MSDARTGGCGGRAFEAVSEMSIWAVGGAGGGPPGAVGLARSAEGLIAQNGKARRLLPPPWSGSARNVGSPGSPAGPLPVLAFLSLHDPVSQFLVMGSTRTCTRAAQEDPARTASVPRTARLGAFQTATSTLGNPDTRPGPTSDTACEPQLTPKPPRAPTAGVRTASRAPVRRRGAAGRRAGTPSNVLSCS